MLGNLNLIFVLVIFNITYEIIITSLYSWFFADTLLHFDAAPTVLLLWTFNAMTYGAFAVFNILYYFHCWRRGHHPWSSAGLELVHRHGAKLSECLLQQHRQLFPWLLRWCSSHNRDDSRAGRAAMDTFLVVIAQELELNQTEQSRSAFWVRKLFLIDVSEIDISLSLPLLTLLHC